ncbi:MAG TPA: 4'-phosphopantetheinyl transferase superfamily protein, partial [Thermoanaerobaculia bacterium]|nr:4'-phosphopantetheinyl transferase superfamily protein [Thermoanaerobaculia bacterium]
DLDRLALRHLCDRERRARHRMRSKDFPDLFLRLWTRKEAFLKATGEGLSRALSSLDLLDPSDPRARTSGSNRWRKLGGWSLADFEPAPGYLAAIAVASRGWSWTWWRLYGAAPVPLR